MKFGKQKVTVYIHARKEEYQTEYELMMHSFDMSNIDSYQLLGTQDVEIDVPEFDLVAGEIEKLKAKRTEELANHEVKLNEIDGKIQKLLAIGHDE